MTLISHAGTIGRRVIRGWSVERCFACVAGPTCPAIGLCLGSATVGILRDSDGYFMFRIGEGY